MEAVRQIVQKPCKVYVERSITEKDTQKFPQNTRPEKIHISSNDLVPGDILHITDNTIMPCDAILLEGRCVVSESLLTGESTTVVKKALTSEDLKSGENTKDWSDLSKISSKYILFCGTNIVQGRNLDKKGARALVIRTGFLTVKGCLVRQILYPQDIKFKFYEDSLKFVAALALLSFLGALISLQTMTDEPWHFILDRMLNLVTITVPPSPATVMSQGMAFSV